MRGQPRDEVAELRRINEELQQRLEEALAREAATAEVLGVINASRGDLKPVFDAMLEQALALCGAAFGQFHTFDGERFQTAALRGIPARYAEYRERTEPIYGIVGRCRRLR